MRDPKRIDKVLKIIRKFWKSNPDLKLGQIIASTIPEEHFGDPFFVEDEDIINGILELDDQFFQQNRIIRNYYKKQKKEKILLKNKKNITFGPTYLNENPSDTHKRVKEEFYRQCPK